MKKFYTNAAAAPAGDNFTLELDGRAIRTPAKTAFHVPTQALALVVAQEWNDQTDTIDLATMPITGLCYAALDRVRIHRASIIADTAAYAGTDLLCYRAESPQELVARQAEQWQPLLDWARDVLGMDLHVAGGIGSVVQPEAVLLAAHKHVDACEDFALAALDRLTQISGSLVIALAVLNGHLDADVAYEISHLEERWQASTWGTDAEAEQRHDTRKNEMRAAQIYITAL